MLMLMTETRRLWEDSVQPGMPVWLRPQERSWQHLQQSGQLLQLVVNAMYVL